MEIRIALRTLLRSRWHAVATIGTIALTISLSSTVFAVVDGVLFKPLPYPESDQLYFVRGLDGKKETGRLSTIDLKYLAEGDPRFGICPIGTSSLAANPDQPERSLSAGQVGANFFEVLGMRPLMGGFMPEHFLASPPDVPTPAILTYRAWKQWLPNEPRPVGRTLNLPGARLAVVGVLPEDFVSMFGGISEIVAIVPFVPLASSAADRWSRNISSALIRLPQNVDRGGAQARLDAVMASRSGDYPVKPGANARSPFVGVRMTSVAEDLVPTARQRNFAVAFFGAMLLVVLGAINVTALTVARAGDRARELAVRAALGAPRAALVRLWLVESTLVAVIGGAVGLALSQPLVQVAAAMIPWHIQLPKPVELDWRVAMFGLVAAILPLLLTAIVPALTASRRPVATSLAAGSRIASARRSLGRGTLLLAESAIGMTLVLVGTLILGGYLLLRSEDVGFDPERLAIVEIARVRGETAAQWDPRESAAFDRVRQVPGVRDVAMIGVPFLGRLQQIYHSTFAVPGGPKPETFEFGNRVAEIPVSGAFFEIAGLRLIAGRFPSRREIDEGQPLAVLNEKAARAYFQEAPPIGRVLDDGKQVVTVIGIVELAQFTSQWRQDFPQIYFPIRLKGQPPRRILLVQTDGRPERVAADIRATLKRDFPGALIARAESLDETLIRGEPGARFDAALFGLAGGAALLLVIVGVAGLVATNVTSRVREMGIRTALGARPAQLIRLVVATQLRPVAIGLAIGLVASWWTSKLVQAYRYDSHDLRVWIAATAIIFCAAIVAAWIPARRASRVDPTVALRAE